MSLNILDMKQVYGLKPYSAMYIKGRYSCLLVQNVKKLSLECDSKWLSGVKA